MSLCFLAWLAASPARAADGRVGLSVGVNLGTQLELADRVYGAFHLALDLPRRARAPRPGVGAFVDGRATLGSRFRLTAGGHAFVEMGYACSAGLFRVASAEVGASLSNGGQSLLHVGGFLGAWSLALRGGTAIPIRRRADLTLTQGLQGPFVGGGLEVVPRAHTCVDGRVINPPPVPDAG